MWTAADRERYGRGGRRYPSDLTDAEWALIAPLIRPAKHGGRHRSVDVREVMNGLLYVVETGRRWRHLPRDLPPRGTVHSQLQRREWDGTLEAVHHRLCVACREQAGKEASPTAAILDSKSVRAAGGKGGPQIDPVGFDAGKKVKGVEYHVLVDTLGPLLSVVVHAANLQDRDGAAPVLDRRTRALFPFILAAFADAGYRGPRAASAARRSGRWRLHMVRRAEGARGFVALPKRWIVERTLSWLTRCRRLARNLENLARTSAALIRLAMIRLMARRLARS